MGLSNTFLWQAKADSEDGLCSWTQLEMFCKQTRGDAQRLYTIFTAYLPRLL